MSSSILKNFISEKQSEEDSAKYLLSMLARRCNLSSEDVLELSEQMMAEEIIQHHVTAFSPVWQGSNHRWYTYLPDAKKKRRMVAKSSEAKLKKEIVDFYRGIERKESKTSLRMIYEDWLDFKRLHCPNDNYIYRINSDWQKYYKDNPIIDVPLKKLTTIVMDEWAHSMIKDHALTKTQYYNMSIIMRQALDYAVSNGLIEKNPLADVKINRRLFRATPKKPDATQVFLHDEQPQIEAEALRDFEKTGQTSALGVALCFQLGVRIGELAAVKWSDIGDRDRDSIHIQRMEVKEFRKVDSKWKVTGYEVVDHVKTDAGNRDVYLTAKARQYLSMLRAWAEENGFPTDGYIFLNNKGERIHARSLDCKIRKYCRSIGIPDKSMHKIRKTYISTLIDKSINLNTVRSLVGHEDERTTLKNYCFNRKSDRQTKEALEKALSD